MRLVLINVGISGGHRGKIFPDKRFVFVPLDSKSGKCEYMPLYDDLRVREFTYTKFTKASSLGNSTLSDIIPALRGKRSHNDPDFKHTTYGHVRRGWGYETLLKSLSDGDILLHYSTLDYYPIESEPKHKSINPDWGAYIVGAFVIDRVYTLDEFYELPARKQQRLATLH